MLRYLAAKFLTTLSGILELGSVPDGSYLKRSGSTLTGVTELSGALEVHSSRTIESSPDTQLDADDVVYFSAATEVDLLTSVTTGREFLYVCTADANLTLDPGGTDTIDGGADGASKIFGCKAGSSVRLIRSGSAAWRAVLSSIVGRQDIFSAGPYGSGVSLDMLSTPAAVKADAGTLGGP